jgi:phenylacetate-CoA ligase
MNWRKPVYLAYASLRGYRFPSLLRRYLADYEAGLRPDTGAKALRRLLLHCGQKVPYYQECMSGISASQVEDNPYGVLSQLPILTKDIIRAQFRRLQSKDSSRRNCHLNTSGGSTGEPVQLLQDDDYRDCSTALQLFRHHLLGCQVGEPQIWLWGSERDLESGTQSRKARFFNWLTSEKWLNAFRMSPVTMRHFIDVFNRVRPRLIVAYAQSAYELARFAEREQLTVAPLRAMMTSAGTLYPFMRDKLRQVFGCEVYNLYGSREVSDIAWELSGTEGLWAPPWANFVEIVDERGTPVPAGTEGDILVTSLTNYAMPLVRYRIGDRGALMPLSEPQGGVQVLSRVSGRNVDTFRRSDQTLVDGEYFTHLMYFRPWVWKFQVVQKSHTELLFKIVLAGRKPSKAELEEIASRSCRAMGDDCKVDFEFPEDIPPLASGKFRYTISEVAA